MFVFNLTVRSSHAYFPHFLMNFKPQLVEASKRQMISCSTILNITMIELTVSLVSCMLIVPFVASCFKFVEMIM